MMPKCKYLKRRDREVKSVDDLFPWSPYLAERDGEFEPYRGPMPKPALTNREREQSAADNSERMKLIVDSIKALDREKDFTGQGLPKVEALRMLAGDDVTLEERNAAWGMIQDEEKR